MMSFAGIKVWRNMISSRLNPLIGSISSIRRIFRTPSTNCWNNFWMIHSNHLCVLPYWLENLFNSSLALQERDFHSRHKMSKNRFIFLFLVIDVMDTKQKDKQRGGKGEKTPMTREEIERFLDYYLHKIEMEKTTRNIR